MRDRLRHLRVPVSLLVPLCALLWLGACGDGDDDDAPQLASDHPGWQSPSCFGCHSPTSYEHSSESFVEGDCSACHGSNGAPDMEHTREANGDQCLQCHANDTEEHSDTFEAPNDCLGCHSPPSQ